METDEEVPIDENTTKEIPSSGSGTVQHLKTHSIILSQYSCLWSPLEWSVVWTIQSWWIHRLS